MNNDLIYYGNPMNWKNVTGCEQRLYCPERSQGEWIIKPKENSQSAILICNKCNHFIPITIDNNFCPNCGADMRKEAENATRM